MRVVPNLYPAFDRQEVVIHTPRHARSLAELSVDEIADVARTWRARREAVPGGYLHALVNEGRAAGASLGHSHSQLVWLAETPPALAEENAGALAGVVEDELRDRRRVVAGRDGLVMLCPRASRLPYELLVAPVEPEPHGFGSERLPFALELVAEGLRRLRAVEGAVPVNVWLHAGEHWHVEVLPRLGVLAGVELGAGIYVNTLAPEEAAARLRAGATP